MSLYYEAADFLTNAEKAGGSLKSRIFGSKKLKNSAVHVYALVAETVKWSSILKDVIDKAGFLQAEKKISPTLSLLLVHDLLLSKNGVAAPDKHALKVAVLRHRTRLSAEFTKIRIRKGYATLQDFKNGVNLANFDDKLDDGGASRPKPYPHPRWVRVNPLDNVKWDLDHHQISGYFDCIEFKPLSTVMRSSTGVAYVDHNIPGLVAFPPNYNITSGNPYLDGYFIIQDKASCFPALLLVDAAAEGKLIDACAAPGNKTTQLAAFYSDSTAPTRHTASSVSGWGHSSKADTTAKAPNPSSASEKSVFAFERSKERSKVLKTMIKRAHADAIVEIHEETDFFEADPEDVRFTDVRGILLDPSCSGSGMIERNEEVDLSLPAAQQTTTKQSKKRKRVVEDIEEEQSAAQGETKTRLEALSKFQQRLIQRAMSFPGVVMIAYSTCSIHAEENESVVIRALASTIAKEKGWTLLTRNQQFNGLKRWHIRGAKTACEEALKEVGGLEGWTAESIADTLLRCSKGSEDGTMGFFAAGFIRRYGDAEKEREMQKERDARRLFEVERQAKWDSLASHGA